MRRQGGTGRVWEVADAVGGAVHAFDLGLGRARAVTGWIVWLAQ